MNNAIQVFRNNNFSVRTSKDDDGTIWFVAKDIALALEYSEESNPSRLMQSVPEIWKGVKRIHTIARGEQEMLCLTEQGVYFFLGRSDKPKALPYQIWIAGDVVPSIRETGSYSIKTKEREISPNTIESAQIIFKSAGISGNQLTLALDKVYRSYTGRSALEDGEIVLAAPEIKQLLTPTEIGRQLKLSARRVNELLAYSGFQHNIAGKWEPIGDGERYAVMLDTNKRHSNGTPVRQLKWQSEIISVIRQWLENSFLEASNE